jgi:mono/diheme cytochrome c family protein/glucose/arabinose dehydrogenase
MRILSALLIVSILAPLPALAQRGDRKGHDMKEVWKDMEVPPAPALSEADALKSFKVAPGFKVELVAGDDMLDNPVTVKWDGDGRMWVVEMVEYMPNVNGDNENVKTGKISVLEDTNGDGRMDKKTVFLDKLEMPRAVALVDGGVLVSEPPNLWYCKDTNGDLKCDEKTSVLQYAKQGPVEHTDNALMFALDNWIYNAKSSRRFQFKDGKIIETKTKGRGQWGITQDNWGRLYYTTNSNWLHADWDTHNQGLKLSLNDKSIHSIRVNPGINRGYQGNMLQKDGRLARVTAISGPGIYRGDVYGDSFINGAFIPEPSANAVGYFEYSSKDDNASFTHKLYKDEKWGKREFLTSTDERFRPVSISTGPDGCIHIVDLYHGILQHKVYVTTFLRKQIVERGLDKDNHRGRIYRIVPDGKKVAGAKPGLKSKSPAELVKVLSHPNGWFRDTAQRLIVQSGDASVGPALKNIVENSDNQLARIHAMWTMRGVGALDGPLLSKLMTESKDSKIRIAATAALVGSRSANAEKIVSNVKKLDKKGQDAYKRGQSVYGTTCFACHQPHGKGMENLAPPLAGSEWVNMSDGVLARIALSGMTGPITVAGKEYKTLPVMPGHGPALDDKKIADVLTYVRNTWGNKGAVVSADTIKQVRAATKDHPQPWTAAELKGVK